MKDIQLHQPHPTAFSNSSCKSSTASNWRALVRQRPRTWLITGVAGFIGSNLLESLLNLEQNVVGLDNFSTGSEENLNLVQSAVAPGLWSRFNFIEEDIRDPKACRQAIDGVDCVLHQAAIGSVPRSIDDPAFTHDNNVNGTLNMLLAARDAGTRRFVYASSSSVYGSSRRLPKVESEIGAPLSPYAVSKRVSELYASAFASSLNFSATGLRYFNVFGPRQNPNGAYAAVIPRWIDTILSERAVTINGDGETSRDFCYIDNVVQANILAALAENPKPGSVYNVAAGGRNTLIELYNFITEIAGELGLANKFPDPIFADFRKGDVRHSHADISLAKTNLQYQPSHDLKDGLKHTIRWFASNQISAAHPTPPTKHKIV
ncbi:NAD-dependent epimerase/dehydratase family protein [Crateriforma conspicua]|uniref:UDP-glucose 4-epimerase n=1 Tax=Crateriforma conspicua TaxID=2527996 RepID=A0A5C5Y4F7_9PLAN|nr:NAD-dependent epimerase/dehydratase family protein [Crateriforma conspicua]TWT70527.1 UDP-glucose 4-epimerase [Crateriforma conspicua]